MKRINKILIFSFIIMGFVILLTTNCKKDTTTTPTPPNSSGIIFNPNLTYGSVTDIDGNVYKTIKIGTQTWMAENLKTTHYNNGIAIPNVTDSLAWTSLTTGAYCDYDNNPTNRATYGRLYNWFTIKTGNLCPIGWHVPTIDEWATLSNYMGGQIIAAGKLKETGLNHWNNPNLASNISGFTALPCGNRSPINGLYNSIGKYGYWWSSIEEPILSAAYGVFMCYDSYILGGFGGGFIIQSGNSVRCIKD